MPPKKQSKEDCHKRKNKSEAGTPGDPSEGEHSASQKPRQSEDEPLGSSQDNAAVRSEPQLSSSSLQGAVGTALLPEGKGHGAPTPLPHPDMVLWRGIVEEWYPNYGKQTYLLPSVPFCSRQTAGQSDLESVATQLSSSSLQGAVGTALLPEGKGHGALTPLPHPDMVLWRGIVEEWYPDYGKQTDFLSSVPFCSRQTVGQSDRESVATQLSSSSLQGAVGTALLPEGKDHGTPTPLPHHPMVFWQDTVRKWYPYFDKETYFLPSVFMNRMRITETQAAGQDVLVINPPVTQAHVTCSLHDKDVREDKAHQKVLDCIHRLQGQAMFVISQLLFGNYLGEPTNEAAAKLLPTPLDPPLASQNKDQGDFDILIIHKDFGILAGEIKSVGDNFSALNKPEEELDVILIKRVKEAIKQMEKSRDVLTYIVPMHHNQQPRIKTTLILPNIAKAQLRRALSACEDTKTALCQSLGLNNSEDPVPLCLTEDDLQNPTNWWNCIMTREGKDPVLESSDSVYLDLISRFCGPATTITVHCPSTPRLALGTRSSLRLPGNGVAETARRFAPADIMLHPKQVDLLNKRLRLVYIAGPPGTGKTVVLLVKALEWLKQKKTVLVFNMQPDGLAASHMIKAQLELSGEKSAQSNVQLLSFDLTEGDDETALSGLENKAQDGKLYIIADEALEGSKFRDFCTKLERRVEGLHLWAAGLKHGQAPGSFKEVILREPLRTPANVTREVQHSGFMTQGVVMRYTKPPGILPTEGPQLVSLLHRGKKHSAKSLYDCMQCGRDIAKKLKDLGVCKPAPENKSQPGEAQTMKERKISGNGSKTAAKHSLRYGDVFILTMEHALLETQPGSCSAQTSAQASSCSGLLQGLNESEIPFRVLKVEDSKGIEEVATLSDHDRVVVAQSKTVCGLERPVVVFVQGGKANSDEDAGRLHAMSRSTAQLIWVRYPTPGEI